MFRSPKNANATNNAVVNIANSQTKHLIKELLLSLPFSILSVSYCLAGRVRTMTYFKTWDGFDYIQKKTQM